MLSKYSHLSRKTLALILTLVLVCSVSSSVITYVVAQSSLSVVTLSGGTYPGASSYTVFEDNGVFLAKSSLGSIDYSSTDAATTIQTALNLLPLRGGTIYIKSMNVANTSNAAAYWNIDHIITMPHEEIQIIGESWNPILKNNANLACIFDCDGLNRFLFKNLYLWGDSGVGVGILLNAANTVIDNCYFRECSIGVASTTGYTMFNQIINSNFYNNNNFDLHLNTTTNNGLFLQNNLFTRPVYINNIVFAKIHSNGFEFIPKPTDTFMLNLKNAWNIETNSNYFELDGETGGLMIMLNLTSTIYSQFINNYMNANNKLGTTGIAGDSNCYENDFSGNQILGCTTTTISYVGVSSKPCCLVNIPAPISISTGYAPTILNWATVFDNAAMHSVGAQNINIVKTGIYSISVNIYWSLNATGNRYLIVSSASTVLGKVNTVSNGFASDITTQSITLLKNLSSGEIVKVQVMQDSGGNLNVSSGVYLCTFSVSWVGPSVT